jgi:hypothetical protein
MMPRDPVRSNGQRFFPPHYCCDARRFLDQCRLARLSGSTDIGCHACLGSIGLLFALAIPHPAARGLLENVELPTIYGTATIQGPDGQRIAFTTHLARLQLYDGSGRFERGWFAKTAGGSAWVGLTSDGKIAVAAARTRNVEFFNRDGSSAGQPQPFTRREKAASSDYLSPSEYLVEGVTFEKPIPAGNPGLHWNTLLLFPLSHPFIAWLFVAFGLVTGNYPRLKEYWKSAWRGR